MTNEGNSRKVTKDEVKAKGNKEKIFLSNHKKTGFYKPVFLLLFCYIRNFFIN